MEQASAQTIATFTGTLLRRERAIEQKFVQLVFREDGKDWLCVSTDPKAATLSVGQNYHIEGEFKQRGGREFVFNPKIDVLKKHWRPIRRVAFIAILVVCVAGFGGIAYMHQHSDAPATTHNNSSTPAITPTSSKITTPSPTTTTAPATPTTTPAPAVTTTTTAKKTVEPKTTAITTQPTAPAATAAPAVTAPTDVCTTQVIGFGFVQQTDASPAGTVIQSGVDGSEQVCTLSGTTITTQPTPEIDSSGPTT